MTPGVRAPSFDGCLAPGPPSRLRRPAAARRSPGTRRLPTSRIHSSPWNGPLISKACFADVHLFFSGSFQFRSSVNGGAVFSSGRELIRKRSPSAVTWSLEIREASARDARLKEHMRRAGGERLAHPHGNGHEFLVGRHVEQFRAIRAPLRLGTAVARDWIFPPWPRNGCTKTSPGLSV